jgi:SAM-dependent methyltransferase
LDHNPDHKPDVVWDLERRPLPFKDATFEEIHAYEVLEHIGTQGDWRGFFAEWEEYARILRPRGFFAATVPLWSGWWAWGDPSHRRVINRGTLSFLSQAEYQKQVGVTTMSDFRHWYKADFRPVAGGEEDDYFWFILQKHS